MVIMPQLPEFKIRDSNGAFSIYLTRFLRGPNGTTSVKALYNLKIIVLMFSEDFYKLRRLEGNVS